MRWFAQMSGFQSAHVLQSHGAVMLPPMKLRDTPRQPQTNKDNRVGGRAIRVGATSGRATALAAALLATVVSTGACVDRATTEPAEPTLSCGPRPDWSYDPVDFYTMDTLVVLDGSARAADHAARLDEHLAQFGRLLEYDSNVGVHLGFVSAQGGAIQAVPSGDACVAPDGPFIEHVYEPWFRCGNDEGFPCAERNYRGALETLLPCVGAVPDAGDVAPTPLEAVVAALDGAPPAFGQANVETLGILIVSAGDDASPLAVDDYVERLAVRAGEIERLRVSVVAPAGADRLRRVAELIPHASFVALDEPDWSEAHEVLLARYILLPFTCIERLAEDTDPDNPGLQPRCQVTTDSVRFSGSLPACKMETPTRPAADSPWPCWWLETDLDPSLQCEAYPHTEGVTASEWECEKLCSAD